MKELYLGFAICQHIHQHGPCTAESVGTIPGLNKNKVKTYLEPLVESGDLVAFTSKDAMGRNTTVYSLEHQKPIEVPSEFDDRHHMAKTIIMEMLRGVESIGLCRYGRQCLLKLMRAGADTKYIDSAHGIYDPDGPIAHTYPTLVKEWIANGILLEGPKGCVKLNENRRYVYAYFYMPLRRAIGEDSEACKRDNTEMYANPYQGDLDDLVEQWESMYERNEQ